jgi:hypothetical protein
MLGSIGLTIDRDCFLEFFLPTNSSKCQIARRLFIYCVILCCNIITINVWRTFYGEKRMMTNSQDHFHWWNNCSVAAEFIPQSTSYLIILITCIYQINNDESICKFQRTHWQIHILTGLFEHLLLIHQLKRTENVQLPASDPVHLASGLHFYIHKLLNK